MGDDRNVRVAVIGGGCAAMAAAFELSRPEHGGRFEVTVYQLGWRLGGKGASGRGAADRIEEHGLHLWMGFYENAFRLMRECYAELGRDPRACPIADWLDAFQPDPFTGVTEQTREGEWLFWKAQLPPTPGLPGDPTPTPRRFTVSDYLTRATNLVGVLLRSLDPDDGGPRTSFPPAAGREDLLRRFLRVGELASLGALLEGVRILEEVFRSVPGAPRELILSFLDAISRNAREQIEARVERDVEMGRLWTILDLTLATIRGIVRFGLVTDPRGFDAIDDYDCREWLGLNGASERSLDSGYLRGLYDLGFSYEDGSPERPRIAAGQALRAMVRAFFTYRGAFFWKMQAGMGDVVFAPLYEVLRRRGVRFEFFHRLENVVPAGGAAGGDSSHVAALDFDVQAEIREGAAYEPLLDVGGLPCWPAAPRWEQLIDGASQRRDGIDFESFWDTRKVRTRTLRVGEDFDLVVLGVGLGAVAHVCREIVARDASWRAMVENVKTVATQAFQIWMRADMKELGWEEPPINVSGFVEPFDTWADMRHLIEREDFASPPPRSLAYFCSVLADHEGPVVRSRPEQAARQRDRVRDSAIRFLDRDVVHLWPRAVTAPGCFRWDLLVDPSGPHAAEGGGDPGSERFASQFWVANVNPSDRYVLSLPGSQAYRISPLAVGYDNLTVAGDWTHCGFNAGCVEAAVMSGRLAAHALSGLPRLEDIVGYDHP